MADTRLRVLRDGEIEVLLDLLDGWPFPDGQRGRNFFRRYVELDPAFEPRNVWVAEQGGELVSCVQIFPRRVRIGGRVLPMGGIGSVFTRPEHRRRGVAGALLERVIDAMCERGMVLSYLLAERLRWYGQYGYRPWSRGWRTLHWPGVDGSPAGGARRYDPAVDAGELERLWRVYAEGAAGAPLDGIVDRGSEEDWRGSFRLAGTPEEDIWIADGETHRAAYLRVADFNGRLRVLEWGREADGASALSELLAAAMAWRRVESIRMPLIRDEALEGLLGAVGTRIDTRPAWDELPPEATPPATWMVRSLDDGAFARRLSTANEGDLLARFLPPDRFAFWEADRF
ncbi:MAG: GNAT family N-acetyltransferase [Acidobacteria bacterium]|nr:GNAT family N-acetyltransferase [Acidobacteriota bacterium]